MEKDSGGELKAVDLEDVLVVAKNNLRIAVLEKQAKEYRLDIEQANKKVAYKVTNVVNNIKENIVVDGNSVVIKRDYLNSYVNDIDKVWNNIAINEIRKNGKIEPTFLAALNSTFSVRVRNILNCPLPKRSCHS